MYIATSSNLQSAGGKFYSAAVNFIACRNMKSMIFRLNMTSCDSISLCRNHLPPRKVTSLRVCSALLAPPSSTKVTDHLKYYKVWYLEITNYVFVAIFLEMILFYFLGCCKYGCWQKDGCRCLSYMLHLDISSFYRLLFLLWWVWLVGISLFSLSTGTVLCGTESCKWTFVAKLHFVPVNKRNLLACI